MAAGQSAIRRANLAVVLQLVAAEGERSRAGIALRTGLNKTTVSSLVAELIASGLLAETGEDEHPGRVGRPARLVRLNGGAVVGVGLELGVDALTVCALDLGGHVRRSVHAELDQVGSDPGPVLHRLAGHARAVIDELRREGARVAGIAVALPGLVDARRRGLIVAPNVGWQDVPVSAVLDRELGEGRDGALPITVDNEANLAALAEHWEGAARDLDDVLCVSGGVGIGAALLLGGELHRGAHGFAGELGHVSVDPRGAPCACGGRGCLETVAGRDAVLARAGVPAAGPDGGMPALVARAASEDPDTLTALGEAGHALGVALAAAVNLVDPQAVVLGGHFGALAPWLLPPVQRELTQRVLASARGGCELRASELGPDAAARGAAAGVLRDVLADPGAFGDRAAAAG